jgi:hyperosmotically inducible protein
MKPFVATLLATALSAAFSSAYAADTAKPDTTAYRSMTEQAAADYKLASAKCTGMTGNERAMCIEEAKVARARVDADAVAQHNNTAKMRVAARTALAKAEHALAVVKCSVMTGAEKDSCLANARSVQTAALADAKADRDVRVAGVASRVDDKGLIANTGTTEPAKAAAVDKCAHMTDGKPGVGCMVDNKDRTAAAVADKTERAVERMAAGTERAAERSADAAGNAAAKTGKAISDTVITTKVKADLFKEPELSAMAIHVETEKGVVMLSGFVDSKADADKAVRLAKSVEGVTQVKSAIKVK